MEKDVTAQVIYCSHAAKGNVPKMYLTTNTKSEYHLSTTQYLLMDLSGTKILELYGVKDVKHGHLLNEKFYEISQCLEKGFVVLTYDTLVNLQMGRNVSEKVEMNVYDYSGNNLYNEKIQPISPSSRTGEVWFKTTVDDQFIDQKISELFDGKKGGEGK